MMVIVGPPAELVTACQHVSRYATVVVFSRPSGKAWISAPLKYVVVQGGGGSILGECLIRDKLCAALQCDVLKQWLSGKGIINTQFICNRINITIYTARTMHIFTANKSNLPTSNGSA